MGWSDWRVPEMDEELELRLLSFELELRKEIHSRGPESLAARFVHQVKVIHQQEQIIHRASKRIAELELEVALAAAAPPSARRSRPVGVGEYWPAGLTGRWLMLLRPRRGR